MNKIKLVFISLLSLSLLACSSGNGATTTNNVVPLIVDAGYNGNAVNSAFITITICQPGTNNCQTLDHVVVDSGSTGLHIDASQLNLALPAMQYSGHPLYECDQYGAGYNFGPIVSADIKIAGETATNLPLSIFEDSAQSNVPSSCSGGLPLFNVTVGKGAKAIMGVGPINPPNSSAYHGLYTCSNNSCINLESSAVISTPVVLNTVSAFKTDNNGVIFKLPNVESATNTPLIGTLTFGINTQADNMAPQAVNVLLADPSLTNADSGYFKANNGTQDTPAIFDSGTPDIEFYSPTMAKCTGILTGVYCPLSSPENWSSTISSYNSNEGFPITLPIVNYAYLTNTPVVLPYLGQVNGINSLWTNYGLTFFYGKSIYVRFANGNATNPLMPLSVGPAWGFMSNN